MRKILVLWSFLLFISLWINYYFISFKYSLNNDIFEEKNIESDVSKIIEEKIYKEVDLNYECNNIINGRWSKFIEKTELYRQYLKARNTKQIKKSNTYLDWINIKKWNCDYFNWNKNNFFCTIINNKDIKLLDKSTKKWSYENILVKSYILNKNICYNLIDKKENKECNMYYDDFMNINKKVDSILYWNSFERSKMYTIWWEDKYLKMLNKEFLEKCINLKKY